MAYVIGVDLGTSGTKTVLFDESGKVIASHTVEYPMYQPKNGYAEQDPADWREAAFTTIRAVMQKSGVSKDDVRAIGLSGQMHGLVMLDKNGSVLRDAIIWCDQRTAEECEIITQKVGAEKLIEITANPALTGFTASKILWVERHEPEIFEKCAHILLPKDYLRYKLTGEFATEVSDASGMQLLDVPARAWSPLMLSSLSLTQDMLPKVYESPEISACISEEGARATGLKKGTPVAGGAGDNAAAAVGTGTVVGGRAFCTLGTSGVVFAHTKKPHIDPKGRVHTFCCSVPNAWHVMGVTQAAGLSLQWFKNNFCASEVESARSLGISVYELLDKIASKIPVGSENLLYLPYLMGERTPHLDPAARGAFFGLSALHTKAHLLRAVMEGVAFSQKDSLEVLNEMGISLSSMLACGGGGTSALWRQMLSDVFNLNIQTVRSKEGPALGVAILAGVGSGVYSSVEEACKAVISLNEVQSPIEENVRQYEKFYSLYKKLYPALKDSFSELRKI